MKIEIYSPLDTLDKCKVLLSECRDNVINSIDSDPHRIRVLHLLDITEILLNALKKPLQGIED